jgi:ligand-binding sensor domain-containing protein
MKKILLIFFVSACLMGMEAKLEFERITLEQGLSQSTIRSIFQDSKGFMWFGSDCGLNRYDGNLKFIGILQHLLIV